MVEILSNFLAQYPQDQILLYYFFFLGLTLTGTIPNNIDLTIIAAAIIASFGKLNIFSVFFLTFFTVLIGENTMFLLGRLVGKRMLEWKLVSRFFPQSRREKIEANLNTHPNKVILTIRITPLLRPIFYMLIGSLGLNQKDFLKHHFKLLVIYCLIMIPLPYLFTDLAQNLLGDYMSYAVVFFFLLWFGVIRSLRKKLSLVESN